MTYKFHCRAAFSLISVLMTVTMKLKMNPNYLMMSIVFLCQVIQIHVALLNSANSEVMSLTAKQ